MKKLFVFIAAAFLLGAVFSSVAAAEAGETKAGKFIRVYKNKLLTPDNKEFTIKGLAFGNNVWGNPPVPDKFHHTEESYKEIAALGFNSVRFYLNYRLFEEDDNPYVYKQSGFDWLDLNIEWAKKYGVKLILNMHVPQGGFQSLGDGMALWTDKSNQRRLTALWKEIGVRYKDEPVIIGYGLVNEPGVPFKNTLQESVSVYKNYINYLVRMIRTADKNHIIFLENLLMVKNLETGERIYDANGELGHFLINDGNTVYEFHNYSPHAFTHQDTDWAGTEGVVKYYPSDEIISFESDNNWLGCEVGNKTAKVRDGFVYYESKPSEKTNTYNMGRISCQAYGIGKNGTAFYDDIRLTEYDSNGKITETFYIKENLSDFWYWSDNGSGTYGITDSVVMDGSASLYIKGSSRDSNFAGNYFLMKDGYKYTVSAWVKTENCAAGAVTVPRIDFVKGTNIFTTNREYLESTLKRYIDFADTNNVPLYLGEFGVINTAFTEKRGALQWVEDMIALCKKYSLHFNYHTFHEPAFGLYTSSNSDYPDKINTGLANLFKRIL